MTTRSLAPLLALGLAALASPAPAASPLAVMPFARRFHKYSSRASVSISAKSESAAE